MGADTRDAERNYVPLVEKRPIRLGRANIVTRVKPCAGCGQDFSFTGYAGAAAQAKYCPPCAAEAKAQGIVRATEKRRIKDAADRAERARMRMGALS